MRLKHSGTTGACDGGGAALFEEGSVVVLACCLEDLPPEWFKATADTLFQARNKKFNKCQAVIWDYMGVTRWQLGGGSTDN